MPLRDATRGEEDVRLLDVLIEQAESVQDPDAFIELLERPVENQAGGVLISTVHGAKGLEWPLVAVAGVNEEDFPYYSHDNPLSDERLEEERRLFYVAITRAKEQLLVLHDGGVHKPSRFIAESAWQDGMRIAEHLAHAQPPSDPVAVNAPSLVERYLKKDRARGYCPGGTSGERNRGWLSCTQPFLPWSTAATCGVWRR